MVHRVNGRCPSKQTSGTTDQNLWTSQLLPFYLNHITDDGRLCVRRDSDRPKKRVTLSLINILHSYFGVST